MRNNDLKEAVDQYLRNCRMWNICELLLREENNPYQEINMESLKRAVYYAVEYCETIKEVLPQLTVHGLKHSSNVLDIMAKLLISMQIISTDAVGTLTCALSSYEAAMLILAAFFHDIGLCMQEGYADVSEEVWFDDYTRGKQHLDANDLRRKYIRDCHHIRVKLFVDDYGRKDLGFGWLETNGNFKRFLGLERICKSHNEGREAVEKLSHIERQDEKFCAIILRLADILDLDNTRAPLNEMESIRFGSSEEENYSWYEWKKHRGAEGIAFDSNGILVLLGNTEETIVYQKLNTMVGSIRAELDLCRELLQNVSDSYRQRRLPSMIKNNVQAIGFEVGQYAYEIEKNDALKLFMGENLYMDKMVFVRELMQNAIDATIYYQKIKEREMYRLGYTGGTYKSRPVSIHVWKDNCDNISFLIEDSGTGMNRDVILNYFLKIGKSFYRSDAFRHSGVSFVPIGRFGVGFLSAFLVTDEITVVTKHYNDPHILLQLTLNINEDEYVLRENNSRKDKYDIQQRIVDWNGESVSLARMFKDRISGTLIYFNIREESINGDMDHYIRAIDKYYLWSPVQVNFDINGYEIKRGGIEKPLMDQITIVLNKNDVCRALHKSVRQFSEDDEIIFESVPVSIDYSDANGSVKGRLQIMTVYDTSRKHSSYRFGYYLDYEENAVVVKFGGYQKVISNAGLNSEYQMLGMVNKVKIYFNGINHLSASGAEQSGAVSSAYFSGYYMLEGQFRPEVDVARSGNGYMNLETIACLNYLYFNEIQNYVKDAPQKRNVFFSITLPDIFCKLDRTYYLEYEVYEKVIRPYDWNNLSLIHTEMGYLSVDEIREIISRDDCSEIELRENIMLNEMHTFKDLLIRYLLKRNFRVILRLKDGFESTYIRKQEGIQEDHSLPPLFLMEYENTEILKYGNYPLNKGHWFSKWFVEKSKSESFLESRSVLIQNMQRDIFNRMDKRNELVFNINRIVQRYISAEIDNREIITFRGKEKDLRSWLQFFE